MLRLRHRHPATKSLDPIRLDVLRALEQSGCVICTVKREWMNKFFFWLLIQNYYAETMILKLIASGGLCRDHAKKLLELGSVYTTSVMYQYLVDDAISKLKGLVDQARQEMHKPSRKPRHFCVTPTGQCPACVDEEEIVQSATRELVAALTEEKVFEKYRVGDALCMPHSYRAVELASPSVVVLLVETQIAKLNELTCDFAEYFHKVDYRFANEPKGNEQTTWQRAIARFVGTDD